MSYVHTYVCAYIHPYIYTYLCTYTHSCICTSSFLHTLLLTYSITHPTVVLAEPQTNVQVLNTVLTRDFTWNVPFICTHLLYIYTPAFYSGQTHTITLHCTKDCLRGLDANETVMCFKQEFLFLLSRWPQFFLSRYRSDVRIAFLSKRVPHLHAAIFLSLLTKHGSDGRNRPTPESPVFRLRSRKWRQSSWWIETSWRESALLRGRGSDLVMFGLRSKSWWRLSHIFVSNESSRR